MTRTRILVSILLPTTLLLACAVDVPEGGDPEDVSHVDEAVFAGDSPDTEVIARAKYWYDQGQEGLMESYTNSHCSITGKNPDGTKDNSCHRDPEGDGVYPHTDFYRRDCSGMASMALHMSYSTTTAGFRGGDFGFAKIGDDADAKMGDLVITTAASAAACAYGNHTIIFEKWIDATHWRGYSGGAMPPSHPTYTVSKSHGEITNMDEHDSCNRVFHVYRSPHVLHGASCTPKSCDQLSVACGSVSGDDNCGEPLDCGGCGAGETCDAGQCAPSAPDAYAKTAWSGRLQNGSDCAEASSNGIEMNACRHAPEQSWHMTADRLLKNADSAKCITPETVAAGSSTREGACSGDDRIWRFRDMRVVNGQTGYCMDVPAADYHVGQRVIQWPCHGADNQLFTYKPQTGELQINGYCLDAGTAASGAEVTLQHCDDTAAQKWNDAHGGFVSAVATSKPRCLALDGGATAGANANLVVANCSDAVEQMWALEGRIENEDEDLCLKNGSDGALKLASCGDDHPAQVFTFWMSR